jgi:hypothetical protein
MKERHAYILDEQESRHIFENDIVPTLYGEVQSVAQPKASFFRGQPGSGKSVVQKNILRELSSDAEQNRIMVVDIDGFRRFHPAYAQLQQEDETNAAFYTDADSGRWTEQAIEYAMAKRSHVTLEGTLRDERPTLETAQQFSEHGVESDMYLMAVNQLVSRKRIFQRYLEQLHERGVGRYTLPEAHDRPYKALPQTAYRTIKSGLFAGVHIVNKDGEVAHQLDGRQSQASSRAVAVVRQCRRLTASELEEIRAHLADMKRDIDEQENEQIQHEFTMLLEEVENKTNRVFGAVALHQAQEG